MKGSRVLLLLRLHLSKPQFNLQTTAQAIQECAISELALHGELMTKTRVQLCDRNLSSVNDTVSEVQAWITRARVTDLLVGRLPSVLLLYRF